MTRGRTIEKVLVANRGEIALRVVRACRELGIRSVAVYSEADRGAAHVRAADEAYPLGPAPASESYLRVEKLLEVARTARADAVHPGYGFLAENAAFAQAVEEAGLLWIGPRPKALEALGDKARAREIARRVGVPVVPGSDAEAHTAPEAIAQAARAVGFPVLLKAAAGGGGKGMRLVSDPGPDEGALREAIAAAQREAQAAFGDPRLLVERYLHPVRHVEVQVLGDAHGRILALGERECSLQRRHQKIVEESPSPAPTLSARLREGLERAAVRLAEAVGYRNAGTVEFLLAPDGSFYFLEVNARLQVEHPVTELTRGVDLVQWQIRLAQGEPLPATLRTSPRGHAIEVRLCAEDPEAGFLPRSGKLLRVEWPSGPGVRVDAGVHAGGTVPPHYDPLLAKLIAWGPDRETARRRLVRALEETVVLGVVTNRDFLLELLESPAFRDGETYTHTVEELLRTRKPPEVPDEFWIAATWWALAEGVSRRRRAPTPPTATEDPYRLWKRLGARRFPR